jgi:hypothetical protein
MPLVTRRRLTQRRRNEVVGKELGRYTLGKVPMAFAKNLPTAYSKNPPHEMYDRR